jgi:putative endonuclease
MKNNRETGRLGEDYAVEYLVKGGYRIITRNFNTRFGELDIIALEGNKLLFIEVKTRRSTTYGYPREAVSYQKQYKIKNMASFYLQGTGQIDRQIRFDIVEVFIDKNYNLLSVNHLENAFF